MRDKAIEEIEIARPFASIYDMLWKKDGKWRFSKFNIRAMGNLIKIGAMDSFNLVGENKMFKNYHHMFEVIVSNKRKLTLKKGKENFEELTISLCDTKDWTPQEKCDMKMEILEEFDMDLLVPEETKDFFKTNKIHPINSYCGERPYWFVLNNAFIKTTRNGKKYILAKIWGENQKEEILFIWNYNELKHKDLLPRTLYIAKEIRKTERGFSTNRNNIFKLKEEL